MDNRVNEIAKIRVRNTVIVACLFLINSNWWVVKESTKENHKQMDEESDRMLMNVARNLLLDISREILELQEKHCLVICT